MYQYINVVAEQLPLLQEVIVRSRQISVERSSAVEDEGRVQAELGNGAETPGGPYVNIWSGVSAVLDTSQEMSNMLGNIAQQVKNTAAALNQVTFRANKASADVGWGVRTQVTSLEANQRADASKVEDINGQQLTSMLGMIQQAQQSHIASCGGAQESPETGASMVNGIPVEDVAAHLQLELQMVQYRLISDATSVAGRIFEFYEDTFKRVVAHCKADDWQYVMDMPALYSLVRPVGKFYETFFMEESNYSKSGYASSAQVWLALSFKTKVP
jgi:hypothetical protein